MCGVQQLRRPQCGMKRKKGRGALADNSTDVTKDNLDYNPVDKKDAIIAFGPIHRRWLFLSCLALPSLFMLGWLDRMGATLGGLLGSCDGTTSATSVHAMSTINGSATWLRGGIDVAAEEEAAMATDSSSEGNVAKTSPKKKTKKKKKEKTVKKPAFNPDPAQHVQRTEPLLLTLQSPQKDEDRFVLTFVGDTMLANLAYNWEFIEWGPERPIDQGFALVRQLLDKSDFIVMNLEGPISPQSIKSDPKHRGHSFSFGMDPRAADVIKDVLGDHGVLNMANNHVADRGIQGWYDTRQHLDRVGLPYFGTGTTDDERALPLLLDTPSQGRIGISTFMGTPSYCCDSLKFDGVNKTHLTQRPEEPEAVERSMKLLEEHNVDTKIGFVHWIQNYKVGVSQETRGAAELLESAGYDVLMGSAGSHTVKEFDWINDKVPCFYDIGNFVFMKPGYWYRKDKEFGSEYPLTYGTVTHLIFMGGKPAELEIHCTQNNQDIVHYNPRPCTPEEAKELFTRLGPFIDFVDGNSHATVDLRQPSRVPPKVAQMLLNKGGGAAGDSKSSGDGQQPQKSSARWSEVIADIQAASRIDNSHLVSKYKEARKEEKRKKRERKKKKKKKRHHHHKSTQKTTEGGSQEQQKDTNPPQTEVKSSAQREGEAALVTHRPN